MLLVWLFALATGIVNACVVEPVLRHAALSSTQQLQHAAGSVGHEHQIPHADQPPCAKFCDDESASAPAVTQQVNPPNPVWLAPPPTLSLAVLSAPEPVGAFHAGYEPLRARIPIPIAFLRLTL